MTHPDGLGVRVEVVGRSGPDGVDEDVRPEDDDGRPGIVRMSLPKTMLR